MQTGEKSRAAQYVLRVFPMRAGNCGLPAANHARAASTPLEPVSGPEATPVPALHTDRDVDLAHHHRIPVAHVARVTLDQVGADVAPSRKPGRIVKDAAIAAVCGVPGNIARTLQVGNRSYYAPQKSHCGRPWHSFFFTQGMLPGRAAAPNCFIYYFHNPRTQLFHNSKRSSIQTSPRRTACSENPWSTRCPLPSRGSPAAALQCFVFMDRPELVFIAQLRACRLELRPGAGL